MTRSRSLSHHVTTALLSSPSLTPGCRLPFHSFAAPSIGPSLTQIPVQLARSVTARYQTLVVDFHARINILSLCVAPVSTVTTELSDVVVVCGAVSSVTARRIWLLLLLLAVAVAADSADCWRSFSVFLHVCPSLSISARRPTDCLLVDHRVPPGCTAPAAAAAVSGCHS